MLVTRASCLETRPRRSVTEAEFLRVIVDIDRTRLCNTASGGGTSDSRKLYHLTDLADAETSIGVDDNRRPADADEDAIPAINASD